jgi:uncharacterized protein YcbX
VTPLATGRVVAVHRWPVKSMGGEAPSALDLGPHGVAGDRAHALFDHWPPRAPRPRRLTARQAPRMLLWRASYGEAAVPADDPPAPTLTAPDGRPFAWDDPALPEALSDDLGREVTLRRDPTLMQDLEDSVLVTVAASHRAVEDALGELELLRWRPNLHVELDAAPFAEERWEGGELRVGAARLALLHPCERCVIPTRDPATAAKRGELLRWLARERRCLFGINARPLGVARVAPGDLVEVRAAAQA